MAFSEQVVLLFAESITQARNAWSPSPWSRQRPARAMRRNHDHDRHARQAARLCGLSRKDPAQLHRPAETATVDNDACLARPAVQLGLAESRPARPALSLPVRSIANPGRLTHAMTGSSQAPSRTGHSRWLRALAGRHGTRC